MTFIASVIAKEGVAIIADSLVTSVRPVIESDDFFKFLDKKVSNSTSEVKIDPQEIIALFKRKPSHTKDYEDKLFKYGKYSAITTAGSASINGQRVKKVIEKAIREIKPNNSTDLKSIEDSVMKLKNFMIKEVKTFLNKNSIIEPTIFLFTSYSRRANKAVVYKITIEHSTKADLEKEDYEFVTVIMADNVNVVCEGQNRLAERLLFGDFNVLFEKIPPIAKRIAKDFGISNEKITNEYLSELLQDNTIMTQQSVEDIKMLKLRDLSLQQAVDLAHLLMRIEIDIQKYTENIPNVGGVIKLAVIDNNGFRFISGHDIENINHSK
jgi:hypothetical protein